MRRLESVSHNLRKYQWADISTGTGGGCVITGPLPIYVQDDSSLATAARILDIAGNCIKNLAGDILIQRGVPYTP
jgi:hypothetical protein